MFSERNRSLDELAEVVKKQISADKTMYRVLFFPDRAFDEAIFWKGNDIEDFIEFFKKTGNDCLYYREARIDDEDERYGNHKGEIAELDVAYLKDGFFHMFRKFADWLKEENESEGSDTKLAPLVENLADKKDAIAETFIERIKADAGKTVSYDPRRGRIDMDRLLREFLCSGYGFDEIIKNVPYGLIEVDQEDMEEVDDFIHGILRLVEKKQADEMIPECIEWARRKGLSRIQKADVAVFLSEKNLPVTSETERAIWQKAAFELKTTK